VKWVIHKGEFETESVFDWLAEIDLSKIVWSYPPRNLVEIFQSSERPYLAVALIVLLVLVFLKRHEIISRMRG
jgi:hypothetical protein